MGNLVTLTIYTDKWNEIEDYPKEFVDELIEAINSGKTHSIIGQTKVQASRHSSNPAVYVQMGNTCCIMDPYALETSRLMKDNPKFFGEMVDYLERTSSDLRKLYNKNRKHE